MLQQGIVSGGVQNSLWCILTLPKQFSDPSGNIPPGQKNLIHKVVFYRVAFRHLEAQFIEPDGVLLSADHNAFAACPVFPFQKAYMFFHGPPRIRHIVVDYPELAPFLVAAGPQDGINNICVDGDLSCIEGNLALLNRADLGMDRREFWQ